MSESAGEAAFSVGCPVETHGRRGLFYKHDEDPAYCTILFEDDKTKNRVSKSELKRISWEELSQAFLDAYRMKDYLSVGTFVKTLGTQQHGMVRNVVRRQDGENDALYEVEFTSGTKSIRKGLLFFLR